MISFSYNAIKSGAFTHGAEQVLQCDEELNSSFLVIFPAASCAPNGNSTYDCNGIDTSNSVIYLFPSGEQASFVLFSS